MTQATMNQTTITAPPDEPVIIIERWFDAPAHLVYEACTQPELIKQWWAPCTFEFVECTVDLRPGGAWRFLLRTPEGHTAGFRGEFRELVPGERVVRTFIYDPYPDADAIETAVLEETAGKTKLTVTIAHKTMEARNGHVGSGMEAGMREAHAALDQLLAKLARAATPALRM